MLRSQNIFKKTKFQKPLFAGSRYSQLTKIKLKICFFNQNTVLERNLKLFQCAYTFLRKVYEKYSLSICPFLTLRHCRKLKTCVTLLTFKINNLHSCLREVVDREVVFRFHLLSRQDRKQYCIDKLNFCFHPTFLSFSVVPFFYTLGLRSYYITILFETFILYLVFKFLVFFSNNFSQAQIKNGIYLPLFQFPDVFSDSVVCGKVKHELRGASYEFRYTSYELKYTSYEFKSTSYEFKTTSSSRRVSRLKARVSRLKPRDGR